MMTTSAEIRFHNVSLQSYILPEKLEVEDLYFSSSNASSSRSWKTAYANNMTGDHIHSRIEQIREEYTLRF